MCIIDSLMNKQLFSLSNLAIWIFTSILDGITYDPRDILIAPDNLSDYDWIAGGGDGEGRVVKTHSNINSETQGYSGVLIFWIIWMKKKMNNPSKNHWDSNNNQFFIFEYIC